MKVKATLFFNGNRFGPNGSKYAVQFAVYNDIPGDWVSYGESGGIEQRRKTDEIELPAGWQTFTAVVPGTYGILPADGKNNLTGRVVDTDTIATEDELTVYYVGNDDQPKERTLKLLKVAE